MGAYLRQYPRYFGDFPVRDVGLIASEGRMTIPLADGTPSGVLDVTSHYFEFIPEEEMDSPQPTVLAAHEVHEGRNYYILPTTAYGLYRYDIHDVVRVTGFHNRTPLVEFLSKGAHFANITGEKLSEYHVTRAMARALRRLDLALTSYSLAPCWDDEQPYYGLFVERGDLADAAAGRRLTERLDALLKEGNIEYAAKRDSLRLGAVRLELLEPGAWREWDRERLKRHGRHAGAIQASVFDRRPEVSGADDEEAGGGGGLGVTQPFLRITATVQDGEYVNPARLNAVINHISKAVKRRGPNRAADDGIQFGVSADPGRLTQYFVEKTTAQAGRLVLVGRVGGAKVRMGFREVDDRRTHFCRSMWAMTCSQVSPLSGLA